MCHVGSVLLFMLDVLVLIIRRQLRDLDSTDGGGIQLGENRVSLESVVEALEGYVHQQRASSQSGFTTSPK